MSRGVNCTRGVSFTLEARDVGLRLGGGPGGESARRRVDGGVGSGAFEVVAIALLLAVCAIVEGAPLAMAVDAVEAVSRVRDFFSCSDFADPGDRLVPALLPGCEDMPLRFNCGTDGLRGGGGGGPGCKIGTFEPELELPQRLAVAAASNFGIGFPEEVNPGDLLFVLSPVLVLERGNSGNRSSYSVCAVLSASVL